ncbi:glycine-rich protein DC9.1-like [Capsella rubella]|uniref:glycine-rich protein DC9.1-like n=1 Tax=Capsella rubella TaxID=81985 RepID=UPI000CD4EA18|nr:glycine-rich protein DC9.1-like [Capsella rubella]
METSTYVIIGCGGFIILYTAVSCLLASREKETNTDEPSQNANNQRTGAVRTSDGGFMLYPAAASLPTLSGSDNNRHHHAGYHHGGHHNGGHHSGGGFSGGGHHGGGGFSGGGHHGGGGFSGCGGGGGGGS